MAGTSALGKRTPANRPDDNTYASLSQGGALTRAQAAKITPTWITTFGSGHGYTTASLGSAVLNFNDTSDPALGTQSVTATTPGGFGYGKTLSVPLDMTGRMPVLWVKVTGATGDLTNYNFINLQLATDGTFANSYTFNISADDPRQPYITTGEWVLVSFPWSRATVTGTPTRSNINAVRVQGGPRTSASVVVFNAGAIGWIPEPTKYPNGAVVLTFDDSYAAHWTVAWAKMAPLGLKGTLFPIIAGVDAAGGITTSQLKAMHDRGGWEVGAHATSNIMHTRGLANLTPAERATELNTSRSWLYANGFEADSYAYPNGFYDPASAADAKSRYLSARTIYAPSHETYPVLARDRIRSRTIDASSTLSALQGYVDQAKANKAVQVFTVHNLAASPTGSTADPTIFNSLIDYIVAQGVPCITMRDLLT